MTEKTGACGSERLRRARGGLPGPGHEQHTPCHLWEIERGERLGGIGDRRDLCGDVGGAGADNGLERPERDGGAPGHGCPAEAAAGPVRLA